MADAAAIGLACGNCLVGIFQQWWYTKHFGASGLPGTEQKSSWLHVSCGFDDPGEAESIYEHMAAASDEQWEAYLAGQPLPRKSMTLLEREAAEENEKRWEEERARRREGEERGRPGMQAWPTEVRPALALFNKLQDGVGTVGGTVVPVLKKGVGVVQEQMDVAKRLRPEVERNESSWAVVAPGDGAAGRVVRRDVTVPGSSLAAPARGEGGEGEELEMEERDVTDAPRPDPTEAESEYGTALSFAHSEAGPSRAPAAWTVSPSVLPPRPRTPPEIRVQPADARLSGDTEGDTATLRTEETANTSQAPESPTRRTLLPQNLPGVLEAADPLFPPTTTSSSAQPQLTPSTTSPGPAADFPADPSPLRVPLIGVQLPQFLRPAVSGIQTVTNPLTAPVTAGAARLRPALGVLDQAKGGRQGSRDSMIERETDPGVYRRLADA